ncbi:MAG: Gfo/Idh/MocA family protein [Anaerolineae bacterium]
MASEKPIAVGIVGLGRSGWNIHAHALQNPVLTDKYKVVAVTDPITARMDEARATFGCRTYPSLGSLIADKEVELVVVATLNNQHAGHSINALKAGKHVLCEKPMATSLADADKMVATAKESGRILTINHNMRFTPALMKVKEILQSGMLGEIILIHLRSHSFRRRWDWQTLKEFDGGEMNNNASHSVDAALFLLGDVQPQVTCDLRRTLLCSGDAEDHVKIMLKAPGAPTVDIEVTNACAMPSEAFRVMGTCGGLAGSHSQLRWRFFDPKMLPARPVSAEPTPDRSYNSEELPWQEETWERGKEGGSGYVPLYLDLYETLRHGKPLAITPESVRRVIAVLEECRRQSPLYAK